MMMMMMTMMTTTTADRGSFDDAAAATVYTALVAISLYCCLPALLFARSVNELCDHTRCSWPTLAMSCSATTRQFIALSQAGHVATGIWGQPNLCSPPKKKSSKRHSNSHFTTCIVTQAKNVLFLKISLCPHEKSRGYLCA